jgi:hypothetical protein
MMRSSSALQRSSAAHLAHGGVDLVGTHELRRPVSEDGLYDGDVSAHLSEPCRNGPPDVV